jgi:hypothetical protein
MACGTADLIVIVGLKDHVNFFLGIFFFGSAAGFIFKIFHKGLAGAAAADRLRCLVRKIISVEFYDTNFVPG